MNRSSDAVFDKQKIGSLSGVDLSRKGSVDAPIQPLIELINTHKNYFTTSSCSGRIIVVDNEESSVVKKQGCKWILTSHDKVTLKELVSKLEAVVGNAVFKFEPFVLHVQCRALTDAQELLGCGVASGFRNSGISVGNKGKFITAIRSTHSLEAPLADKGRLLVSTEYLQYLVTLANSKMDENLRRIDKFFENLKELLLSKEKNDKTVKRKKGQTKKSEHLNNTAGNSEAAQQSERLDAEIVDNLLECNLFESDIT